MYATKIDINNTTYIPYNIKIGINIVIHERLAIPNTFNSAIIVLEPNAINGIGFLK
jgi:hypothetical protein